MRNHFSRAVQPRPPCYTASARVLRILCNMMNDHRTDTLLRLCETMPLWQLGVEGLNIRLMHAEQGLRTLTAAAPDALPVTVSGAVAAHILWSWQKHPLDRRLCGYVTALFAGHPSHDRTVALAHAVLQRSAVPPEYEAWRALADADPQGAMLRCINHIADEKHACFWLGQAFELCLAQPHDGLWEKAAQALPVFAGADILAARLQAEYRVCMLEQNHAEHADKVRSLLRRLEKEAGPLFGLWVAEMQVETALKCADTRAAHSVLQALWRQHPWHPSLTQGLYSLMHPAPLQHRTVRDNPPAILLYSWNKPGLLRRTLQTLRDSDMGNAPVFVLDNGSDRRPAAETAEDMQTMLETMRGQWPAQQLHTLRLPVNIGAPAARNWLLSLPQVRRHQWAVFLDDDILLPPQWLVPLMSAALENPRTATAGCTVLDHTPPYAVQCADFFLIPPDMGTRSFSDIEEQMHVYCNAAGSRSVLAGMHTRPCLSVSGCCHALNMRAVEECGPFDIRFSPTQFDDLERDIRCAQAGFATVYTGSVRIPHMQHSSMRQAGAPAKLGHIMGNKIKLEHLYPAGSVQAVREQALETARSDLLRKHSTLCRDIPAT